MKKTFKDLEDSEFTLEFSRHDISKYDVLFHVTLKSSRKSIEGNGLLRNQPSHKSLIKSGLLFMSYPIDMDTSDCFRWSDEHYSLIILDAKKLYQDGYEFYDDHFGSKDQSSKRNHICCDADIPAQYIKKIIEF